MGTADLTPLSVIVDVSDPSSELSASASKAAYQRRSTEWAIWRTVAPGVSPMTVIRWSSCLTLYTLRPPFCRNPAGADAATSGSTNTLTETRPSENTRWATRSRRPRSLRKPSMIFAKPGGTRVTTQPVSCGVDVARSAFEHLPVRRNDRPRRLDHRAIDPRIDREVGERELLDAIAALVQHARLQQQAGGAVGPESVPVAQSVLRLEHDDLHRAGRRRDLRRRRETA